MENGGYAAISDKRELGYIRNNEVPSLAHSPDRIRAKKTTDTKLRSWRVLRARGERPRGGRTADERDELAPVHSITSSARSRNDSGIVSPSAMARSRLGRRSELEPVNLSFTLRPRTTCATDLGMGQSERLGPGELAPPNAIPALR